MFSQRAKILVVFTLDHALVMNIPPQINIKVCLLKEMLGKYILKLSVISLSCHQLEEKKEKEEPPESVTGNRCITLHAEGFSNPICLQM